jgi:hypothetical protein
LEHAGEPRPFPKEDTQKLTKLSEKRHFDAFSIKRDEVKQFRDDQRCIKAAMINSLSPDIAAMLRDPIHGFAKLGPAEIMQKLEQEFGTMTEKDIAAIRVMAQEDIISASELPGKTAKMRQRFGQLANAGQPLSQHDQMHILTVAVARFSAATTCVVAYKTEVPRLQDRSFNEMVNYVWLFPLSYQK